TFKYVEPLVEDLKAIRESSKVQVTHKATQVWVKVLEEFCANVRYGGKIENVDSKVVLKNQLCKFVCAMKRRDVLEKPINILNPKVFYDLNTVMNKKVKTLSAARLDECNRADGLTINEVEQILEHPTMQRTFSKSLLHYVRLYRSKTNQRGLDNRDEQAETISLPNVKIIIDDYEIYFTKHSATAVTNFYLKPCTPNASKQFLGSKRTLKGYFCNICETTGITISDRIISNHLDQKTSVQVLKGLGYSNSVVMFITRHKTQQGLASYECPKSVMQQEGLNEFFSALSLVTNSSPPELQYYKNSKVTNQAKKSTETFVDFILASLFDMSKGFLAIDNSELP
ncbi:1698_t:CDS:2, partial [Cetraspora pellucida]